MTSFLLQNPVLPGFHPDPSFCRVGDDYYLATSTFEWFPGVALHHSRDLVHWRPIGHALTRRSHLDLRGVPDSGGSWAPSLSHADGLFWLVYTNVVTTGKGRPFKDMRVFLSTAPNIEGPWSDPVRLNSLGFDPSLFHDEDGRKWIINLRWDHRPGRHRFAGIVAQEYDPVARRLVGPLHELMRKPDKLCEGPNLYRHSGYYYLMQAEGGTGWRHGISMARSRQLLGPYEPDPQPLILTSWEDPDHPLQKAGHGELVETPAGEWWLAHLCSRPLRTGQATTSSTDRHGGDFCVLGRETALQRVEWTEDGWLRLAQGGTLPSLSWPAPSGLKPHPWPLEPQRTLFTGPGLDARWQTLRVPASEDWLSFTARPGWLRLTGRESPQSLHEQSLIARRLTSFAATATARVDFSPTQFTQFGGLVCWYDTRTYFALQITHDEVQGRMLCVTVGDDLVYSEPEDARRSIPDWPCAVCLRARINHGALEFFASPDGNEWTPLGGIFDAHKLSDDYGSAFHFTGAMIGLSCHDVAGQGASMDVEWFELDVPGTSAIF
ncbi:MAG: glycoside hydrolase family 43 protein [Candidatus Methylacidiphilales bacterium]|nr:glycoside hydrolase family 43 protein [Candidatus Methylacidiphilales bacterium]